MQTACQVSPQPRIEPVLRSKIDRDRCQVAAVIGTPIRKYGPGPGVGLDAPRHADLKLVESLGVARGSVGMYPDIGGLQNSAYFSCNTHSAVWIVAA